MRLIRQNGQRGIVTHGSRRFGTVVAHRSNGPFNVLAGKSECTKHPVVILYLILYFTSATQGIEFNTVGRQPLTIRFGCGQLFLQFAIIIDFSFLGIDQQNFTWLQTPFFFNVSRFEADDSRFTGNYHYVVLGNQVAGRTQSVTVEHTAGIPSVTEQQGCRPIPWFHQNGVVLIKGFQVFTDRILVVEGFRYQHGHGMWQAQTGHYKKFQYIIKRSAVAHIGLDNWSDILDVP